MNSSGISVYDNVNTTDGLSKSSVYRKLNDLLNVNTELEVRIYCPLCVNSFSYKFSLFEHLKTFHDNFLTQASNQTLKFKECPFCNSKFYGNHLTAKHVLIHHSKVIKGLFTSKIKWKCNFCEVKFSKDDHNSFGKHIEEQHFLDFEEEFRKMFSYDISHDMSMSELINSTAENEDSQPTEWEDVCMKVGINSGNDSNIKDFDEASKINCYDFKELKLQLENIKSDKSVAKVNLNSGNKSILRDIKNSNLPQRSARRVLRFDLPPEKDTRNSVIEKNFSIFKQIYPDSQNLLCNDNKFSFIIKSNETFNEQPQHCSTPNHKSVKIENDENKIKPDFSKSSFKSFISDKFEFQCGKCRLLFKENVELVSHVKNNHKKFSLNAFQPCYHCAICKAKFYRNCYLRKHHNLHKPY